MKTVKAADITWRAKMSEIKLEKWTIDKMLSSFNRILAKMDIPVSDKLAIEGMLITLGYEAQKAADVVEVVRCKDCRFLGIKDFVYGHCEFGGGMGGIVMPDSYCSKGQRKEGET